MRKFFKDIGVIIVGVSLFTVFIYVFVSGVNMGGAGSYGENRFYDNIDGASRVVIKNLNNGTSASAQLNIFNDVEDAISIGIASSNLNISAIGAGNGAILVEAEKDFIFGNTYEENFIWKTNPDDDGDFTKMTEVMRLNRSGLTIDGSIDVDSLMVKGTDATISSGEITYETSYMTILGEGGISDELDTINGGEENTVLNIIPQSSASDIKLKDSTGNLNLGADCNLKAIGHKAELIKNSSGWDLIVCLN
jgi:hypothetical protein